eukprot:CAMPEP_0175040030 /NCGR_PEP_ID=MMETSP0052_2-20121109/997_1 /TAXON_ID=51329 ORGANISM="Polytomella parva, Strain SAG 63-3" /NCGR_SAMPLE_ID=MMETSP0052_2 /ASSEMBLY_ACC=CAM_ASM_000194 /LENGTH=1419 /DNA_ID=CAMNT_0016302117 /DNA_START=59 /DNA_END=4315 /DNA_ORIENTATION=-
MDHLPSLGLMNQPFVDDKGILYDLSLGSRTAAGDLFINKSENIVDIISNDPTNISVLEGSSLSSVPPSVAGIKNDSNLVDNKTQICFEFTKGQCTRGDKCKYSHDLATIVQFNSKEKGICFDFLRNQCNRGLLCRFSHDLSNITQQCQAYNACATTTATSAKPGSKPNAICYDFVKGLCQRGGECKYSHDLSLVMKMVRGAGAGPNPQADSKTEMCYDFLRGKCNRGTACKYSHNIASLHHLALMGPPSMPGVSVPPNGSHPQLQLQPVNYNSQLAQFRQMAGLVGVGPLNPSSNLPKLHSQMIGSTPSLGNPSSSAPFHQMPNATGVSSTVPPHSLAHFGNLAAMTGLNNAALLGLNLTPEKQSILNAINILAPGQSIGNYNINNMNGNNNIGLNSFNSNSKNMNNIGHQTQQQHLQQHQYALVSQSIPAEMFSLKSLNSNLELNESLASLNLSTAVKSPLINSNLQQHITSGGTEGGIELPIIGGNSTSVPSSLSSFSSGNLLHSSPQNMFPQHQQPMAAAAAAAMDSTPTMGPTHTGGMTPQQLHQHLKQQLQHQWLQQRQQQHQQRDIFEPERTTSIGTMGVPLSLGSGENVMDFINNNNNNGFIFDGPQRSASYEVMNNTKPLLDSLHQYISKEEASKPLNNPSALAVGFSSNSGRPTYSSTPGMTTDGEERDRNLSNWLNAPFFNVPAFLRDDSGINQSLLQNANEGAPIPVMAHSTNDYETSMIAAAVENNEKVGEKETKLKGEGNEGVRLTQMGNEVEEEKEEENKDEEGGKDEEEEEVEREEGEGVYGEEVGGEYGLSANEKSISLNASVSVPTPRALETVNATATGNNSEDEEGEETGQLAGGEGGDGVLGEGKNDVNFTPFNQYLNLSLKRSGSGMDEVTRSSAYPSESMQRNLGEGDVGDGGRLVKGCSGNSIVVNGSVLNYNSSNNMSNSSSNSTNTPNIDNSLGACHLNPFKTNQLLYSGGLPSGSNLYRNNSGIGGSGSQSLLSSCSSIPINPPNLNNSCTVNNSNYGGNGIHSLNIGDMLKSTPTTNSMASNSLNNINTNNNNINSNNNSVTNIHQQTTQQNASSNTLNSFLINSNNSILFHPLNSMNSYNASAFTSNNSSNIMSTSSISTQPIPVAREGSGMSLMASVNGSLASTSFLSTGSSFFSVMGGGAHGGGGGIGMTNLYNNPSNVNSNSNMLSNNSNIKNYSMNAANGNNNNSNNGVNNPMNSMAGIHQSFIAGLDSYNNAVNGNYNNNNSSANVNSNNLVYGSQSHSLASNQVSHVNNNSNLNKNGTNNKLSPKHPHSSSTTPSAPRSPLGGSGGGSSNGGGGDNEMDREFNNHGAFGVPSAHHGAFNPGSFVNSLSKDTGFDLGSLPFHLSHGGGGSAFIHATNNGSFTTGSTHGSLASNAGHYMPAYLSSMQS